MKRAYLDFKVAPVCSTKALKKTLHAYIMGAYLSGSIDNIDRGKKSTPLFPFKSTSSQAPSPSFTILIAQYWVTNKADYHYLLLQSVSGIFDWSRKNLGLFMSPCIDLTLVRMNCRSIGLPLGRLNEEAQHPGLLLSGFYFLIFIFIFSTTGWEQWWVSYPLDIFEHASVKILL